MNINELLKVAVAYKASDLHISSEEPPAVRIDGDLQKMDLSELSIEAVDRIIKSITTEEQYKLFKEKGEVDFSYPLKDVARFRVNAFKQDRGLAIAFRTIPEEMRTFTSLGLPVDLYRKFCNYPNGIIIITGPTGSGKSTTLSSMINYINSESEGGKHILTIEDPIEYTFKSDRCLIHQREVGRDTNSFQSALRVALREDPDVIMVGEMRDLETIQLALTAAETGHLVFATLHTSSAAKAIDRIIDVFPAGERDLIRQMLSESLQVVIAQTLLKQPGGGRRAAQEIMVCTPAIRNLIREHKIAQIYSAIQTGKQYGMKTMEQDIERLVEEGAVIRPTYLEENL